MVLFEKQSRQLGWALGDTMREAHGCQHYPQANRGQRWGPLHPYGISMTRLRGKLLGKDILSCLFYTLILKSFPFLVCRVSSESVCREKERCSWGNGPPADSQEGSQENMFTVFNYILSSGASCADSRLWALYAGPWQAAQLHPAYDQEPKLCHKIPQKQAWPELPHLTLGSGKPAQGCKS